MKGGLRFFFIGASLQLICGVLLIPFFFHLLAVGIIDPGAAFYRFQLLFINAMIAFFAVQLHIKTKIKAFS